MSVSSHRCLWLIIVAALCGSAASGQVLTANSDLPNFHQVSPTFFRGAQPTQNGFELLAKQGVKTIINLRAADEKSGAEKQWAQAAGLRYFNVPFKGYGRPTDAQVQEVLTVIETVENQPVFLHCKRGKDRTGTIVACYRIAHDQWTREKALAEAKSLRLGWSEFGMKRYIQDFRQRLQPGGNKTIVAEGVKKLFKAGALERR